MLKIKRNPYQTIVWKKLYAPKAFRLPVERLLNIENNWVFRLPDLEKNFDLTQIAKIITYVIQPLLMPTLVFSTLLFYVEDVPNFSWVNKWRILGLVFITTCLIPIMTMVVFKLSKVIKDFHMKERRERYLPFLFVSLFYLIVSFMFRQQEWVNPLMEVTFLTITTVVIITNGITFKYKISAHAAGVFGWLGFILAYSQLNRSPSVLLEPLLLAVILSGLVSWARLYLNAHSPKEVLAGAILGFSFAFSSIQIFV